MTAARGGQRPLSGSAASSRWDTNVAAKVTRAQLSVDEGRAQGVFASLGEIKGDPWEDESFLRPSEAPPHREHPRAVTLLSCARTARHPPANHAANAVPSRCGDATRLKANHAHLK